MKKDSLNKNSIMWVNHYDQVIKSNHFHSVPLLKIRVRCVHYFYSFVLHFVVHIWAWGEQKSLRRFSTCTRSVEGNLFIFTGLFDILLLLILSLNGPWGGCALALGRWKISCSYLQVCWAQGLSHSIQLLELVSYLVNRFFWWKCLDWNGLFWCSECEQSRFSSLYDAIHGWMMGRMDGRVTWWKKLHEKRPRRPLLYVMINYFIFSYVFIWFLIIHQYLYQCQI
jgi:hypothetical protein